MTRVWILCFILNYASTTKKINSWVLDNYGTRNFLYNVVSLVNRRKFSTTWDLCNLWISEICKQCHKHVLHRKLWLLKILSSFCLVNRQIPQIPLPMSLCWYLFLYSWKISHLERGGRQEKMRRLPVRVKKQIGCYFRIGENNLIKRDWLHRSILLRLNLHRAFLRYRFLKMRLKTDGTSLPQVILV